MSRERAMTPVPIADQIDQFVIRLGQIISWVYAVLVAVIITQVVLRKGFSAGQIVLEELQWHLYAIGFMFGLSYSQAKDSHVRVDLFYNQFSPRMKHIVEIVGMVTFVLPLIFVVVYHSLDFVYDSWRIGERSDAPAGLPYRWLIKSVIPASFILLGVAVLSRIYRESYLLIKGEHYGN